MASLTVENYIKTIYQMVQTHGGTPAGTGQIATQLGVSPGTVTSMLKTLSESSLATYTPYEGVSLTPAGTALALRVVRRHRLIELFLVHTLNLTWDEVHEEAEHMEHAVSDMLVDRIDQYLGNPSFDPHGDPIPRADGSLVDPHALRLSECQPNQQFRVTRVLDQTPEFLRYLSSVGLKIGTEFSISQQHPAGGLVEVNLGKESIALGISAAEKIMVENSAS